jgi:ribonuclease HII
MADFHIEKKIIAQGYKTIAGVDEVGRGALFGPVIAASVTFPLFLIEQENPSWLDDLHDSKSITSSKRELLADHIIRYAQSIGIGIANHQEIDQKNIYRASLEAMKRAVQDMSEEPDFLLVDGFCLDHDGCPQMGIPQGDKKSNTIAAASIIAKVQRDEMMRCLDSVYQGYSLAENKGYGTESHFKALEDLGPTSLHRQSFNLMKNIKT